MTALPAWWQLPAAQQATHAGEYGAVLRMARLAVGLTLAHAGQMAGYSESAMSRFETGKQPLTDVTLLRRLAHLFNIPTHMFGLTDVAASPARILPMTGTVDSNRHGEDGDDSMRRRNLLAGFAALPLLPALPSTQQQPAADHVGQLAANLEDLLLGHLTNRPAEPTVGAPQWGRLLAAVKADFQASRYQALATRLPRLIQLIDTDPRRAGLHMVAEAYNTALQVLIKLEVPDTAWIAADRAMGAARASGDPVLIASITRNTVSLCRRAGRYGRAEHLALTAAEHLDISRHPDPARISLYGMLLCNAGYAAAQAGDRSRATELLNTADDAATLLGSDQNAHWTAFGPTNVILHRISAAHALGDAGTAIEHAKRIAPGMIQLPERQSRYWVDVARAYEQWGKPAQCYQALAIAENIAPQEVRSRPVVRTLTTRLLSSPHRANMAGLRELADRVGATG